MLPIQSKMETNTHLSTCCLCLRTFTPSSQPRIIPTCHHSACTSCISTQLKHASNTIRCQHCQHSESTSGVDLEHFPKNISLIKSINRAHYSQLETSGSSMSSEARVKSVELCPQHQKELQIICLDDVQRICPHCALFGQHKDHQLKTVAEAQTVMAQQQQEFIECKLRKVELEERIGSTQFKDEIVSKINKEKQRLVLEVKKKFTVLQQNIKLAEKKVFQEIVKKFKGLFTKITAIMRQESEAQKNYMQWTQRCGVLFNQAQKMERIEQKARLYFGGELQVCREGKELLKSIEETVKRNMKSIQNMVGGIRIVQNATIANSVFNYINVQVQLEDQQETSEQGPESPKEKVSQKATLADNVIEKSNQSQASSGGKRSQEGSPSSSFRSEPKQEVPPTNLLTTPQRPNRVATEKSASKVSKSIRGQKSPLSPRVDMKSPLSPRVDMKSPTRATESRSPGSAIKDKAAVEKIVEDFCNKESADSLDLTNCGLGDQEIIEILRYLQPRKKLKGVKLVKNRLTTEGLTSILEYIATVTNLNLSFNLLSDEVFSLLVQNRPKVPLLRIMNLSNNKINERKGKERIDELKRMGLIVTI